MALLFDHFNAVQVAFLPPRWRADSLSLRERLTIKPQSGDQWGHSASDQETPLTA